MMNEDELPQYACELDHDNTIDSHLCQIRDILFELVKSVKELVEALD